MSTSLMFGCFLAFAPQTSVDRSGEPALKALLESMGQLRGARILVSQLSRESASQPFFSGNNADISWDGPNRFRVVLSNMWGDGAIYVGEGTTYARDPLDMGQPFKLKTLGPSLIASVTELAVKGENQVAAMYVLDGLASLEKLAPKTANVRVLETKNAIEINPSPFGKLILRWIDVKGMKLVDELEFDNWDSKVESHNLYPDWVDMPQTGTLDIENIRYLSIGKKLDKKLFVTAAPKGLTVADERKKPSW